MVTVGTFTRDNETPVDVLPCEIIQSPSERRARAFCVGRLTAGQVSAPET